MSVERQTAGARALLAHLAKKKQSVTAFCHEHGLDRIQVGRAISGQLRRFSVDFAYAIERATRGQVRCHLWRSETARPIARAA
jgi:hypothetical protein